MVDDVITKGAKTLALASIIADHFPSSEICAFAMVRTIYGEVVANPNPMIGTITLNPWGDAERDP